MKEILRRAIEVLQNQKIESPFLVAELLICHVLLCVRNDLHRIKERKLNEEEVELFNSMINRAANHEPVQYIIGETEFMGLTFYVDRRVLIPRPETEVLVEKVIEVSKSLTGPIKILDIGTGSGNIAISIAKILPQATVDAIDLCEDPLTVARKNIERNQVQSQVKAFIHDINNDPNLLFPPYEIIVSNPPYVSVKEGRELPRNVIEYEPHAALFDYGDGLSFYRRIAAISPMLLKKDGLVALEMSYDQSVSIQEIFKNAGFVNLTITKDYSGIERVLTGQLA
ncbi:MAG: peptide chain release factor N(5)-glutamine methyltransferase [Bacteroidota bacterium]